MRRRWALAGALLYASLLSAPPPLFGGAMDLKRFFEERLPRYPLITSAQADLNDDGREDLIVIYRIAPETNRMRVILNLPEGPVLTNEYPAPVENQVIQLKDIDDAPPMEFIVFGSKGMKTGFAIYRCHHDSVEDLFGEDMHDCCN